VQSVQPPASSIYLWVNGRRGASHSVVLVLTLGASSPSSGTERLSSVLRREVRRPIAYVAEAL
jgi:hypothetical protein